MHIPRSGFLASVAESSRSIALILGLLTRVAALGIAAVMAITVAISHWQYRFFMNWFGNQKGGASSITSWRSVLR